MIRTQAKTSYLIFILCGLIVANVFMYREVFAPPVLTISVFNMGKGSALLVRTPNGKTVLINTGPDASILRALGTALPMWQRKLDAIVLTGASANLVGGLPAVMGRYRVSTVEKSPYGKRLSLDALYIDVLTTTKSPIVKLSYGATTLTISTSTPAGTYTSDGISVSKTN